MKKLEILKYDNDLQTLKISPFNLNEAKLFFKLLKIVQNNLNDLMESNEKNISISYSDMRKIIGRNNTKNDFEKLLNGLIQKCLSNFIVFETQKSKDSFVMFNGFTQDKVNNKLICYISPQFLRLLNNLLKNYSTLNINEIVKLKSKYALIGYKKVREFYNNKTYKFFIDSFKKEFGLKENVRWEYINVKVLTPITNELSKLFDNFKITKEKSGRNIKSILFTWDIKENIHLNDV